MKKPYDWLQIIMGITVMIVMLGSFFWYAWKCHLVVDKILWG